jgi:hypothetical protein
LITPNDEKYNCIDDSKTKSSEPRKTYNEIMDLNITKITIHEGFVEFEFSN